MMLLLDAELISIAAEVMSCIPGLQSQRLKYQLNHSGLLQAALSYCSVPKDKRKQLYSLLNDYKVSLFIFSNALDHALICYFYDLHQNNKNIIFNY